MGYANSLKIYVTVILIILVLDEVGFINNIGRYLVFVAVFITFNVVRIGEIHIPLKSIVDNENYLQQILGFQKQLVTIVVWMFSIIYVLSGYFDPELILLYFIVGEASFIITLLLLGFFRRLDSSHRALLALYTSETTATFPRIETYTTILSLLILVSYFGAITHGFFTTESVTSLTWQRNAFLYTALYFAGSNLIVKSLIYFVPSISSYIFDDEVRMLMLARRIMDFTIGVLQLGVIAGLLGFAGNDLKISIMRIEGTLPLNVLLVAFVTFFLTLVFPLIVGENQSKSQHLEYLEKRRYYLGVGMRALEMSAVKDPRQTFVDMRKDTQNYRKQLKEEEDKVLSIYKELELPAPKALLEKQQKRIQQLMSYGTQVINLAIPHHPRRHQINEMDSLIEDIQRILRNKQHTKEPATVASLLDAFRARKKEIEEGINIVKTRRQYVTKITMMIITFILATLIGLAVEAAFSTILFGNA